MIILLQSNSLFVYERSTSSLLMLNIIKIPNRNQISLSYFFIDKFCLNINTTDNYYKSNQSINQ